MQRDLHHNIAVPECLPPTTVGTTGTGKTSSVINRAGYQGVEFIISYGAATATNATVTPTLMECTTSNGTFTSVADIDMLPNSGAELAAALVAGTPRASGVNMNFNTKIGYVGTKQYLKIKEVPTVSAGIDIAIAAILYSPSHAPAGATEV